eukprot:CAMPEP_0206264822 /NCGR_PEP_ID=MMETSP0047_2-20121206/29630_1 /ASSEMBLY_ACC=CAM_ASM_000192 /TAXON_ID=195065 /ORGANISM="Chroomonas mesostigmatica_cf, Strain CCMP1168" /LENGTH=77 /DNA_ID=CAMNT_0053692603 /DNA_START=1 /DNA_END=230 /DNA_ORIENTATION=+
MPSAPAAMHTTTWAYSPGASHSPMWAPPRKASISSDALQRLESYTSPIRAPSGEGSGAVEGSLSFVPVGRRASLKWR